MKRFAFILALAMLLSVGCACAEGEVAQGSSAAAQELEGLENMQPITADMLNEGEYAINVDTTSSMFRVDECVLTVKDGAMTARMTMSGKGYLYVFMGTGEEAAAADDSALIPFEEDESGRHTYTVPVEALDKPLYCSAFSKNKEKWYERQIVFRAASLPLEALGEGLLVTAQTLNLEDGEYTVAVALKGGSGRTTIESPARLRVEDGRCWLTVVFSSPNYDYMIVDGEKYTFINEGGNSTFEVPAAAFDRDLVVIADTLAMSRPHEIEYAITMDSATIARAES